MIPAVVLGAVCVVAGAIVAHELTHVFVARLFAPVSASLESWLPFRIRLRMASEPPAWGLRLIGAAPFLVGVLAAVLAVGVGLWDWLTATGPYYTSFLTALVWLVYAHLSPADLRVIHTPVVADPPHRPEPDR